MEAEIMYGPKSSEFDAMLKQFLQHRRDGMQAQLVAGVIGDDIRRTHCECDDCTAVVVDWIHVYASESVKAIIERPKVQPLTRPFGGLFNLLNDLKAEIDRVPSHEHDANGDCIVEGHPDYVKPVSENDAPTLPFPASDDVMAASENGRNDSERVGTPE